MKTVSYTHLDVYKRQGFGKFVSVWIGGEISDHVGRKKLMIGGAALYILCFLGFLFTKSALVASVCGFVSGVATSGFWDASGYPAVQEAYPAAPGSAPVSYTHLDVYKRQNLRCRRFLTPHLCFRK